MKSFSVAALLAIPLATSALQITSPVPGITWNSTGGRTVSWTNGPNDPAGFAMYLVNYNTTPAQIILINADVTTSDDSYTFDTALPAGTAQIEFTATQNDTDILAQSGQFSIVIGGPQGCSSCTGVASATSSASAISVGPAATTLAGASQTPVVRSDAYTNGSRGFALAVGMMAIGLTALFFVA